MGVIRVVKQKETWKQSRTGRMMRACALLLAIVFVFGGIFQGGVYAAEKKVVKVAFFPMDGYHVINADGSFGGMDLEYMKAICEYTDWDVQYVQCDSWEAALELLADKKVDLVGTAQYSAARAEIYQYADLASGYTFGVIATNAEETIAYEDFEAMQDITYGVVKSYVRKEEFLQYLNDNHVSNPTIREYESTAEMQQALEAGELDAVVHTFTEVREGQRLIGRFAPRPFYYITYKGNDDVMRQLNQAIADLKMNRPELETDLMNEFYYSRFDKAALLTTAEKNYIQEKKKITVGYLDGHYPFSYEEDGEFKGLARDTLEAGIAVTGMRLAYLNVEDEESARLALQNGEIDVLAYCTDSDEILRKNRLINAQEYADIPLVLVTNQRYNVSSIRTVATVSYLGSRAQALLDSGDKEIRICDTQQEGLSLVRAGEVDAVLCDGYLAEHLLRTELQYEPLQIKNVYSVKYPLYLSVRESDSLLSGILTKTTAVVSPKAINEYMLKENTYPLVSIQTFIQNNSVPIIGVLLSFVILVIFVARHIVSDEKKIRKLMYKDTGMDIWNLNYLLYWGEHKLLPDRKDRRYAVVYVNVSRFRRYNIIYGWNAGMRLLESVGMILKSQVDDKLEICARNQGDRFVMLLSYEDEELLLERLAELKKLIERTIYEDTGNRMLVQMGIYFIPQAMSDLQLAVSYAYLALDYTGTKEENAVMIYDEDLKKTIQERHEREKLLESVDVNKDFAAYYQPKVDIRTGEIVGAEALVRFLNPQEGGAVKAPGFFVPYYEQTGRITEIDFFVYEEVCKMLRRRLDAGEKVVPVSCNFSRLHFIRPGFADRFEEVLDRYRISKDLIEVEITETLIIEKLQLQTVRQTLDDLHQRGIQLSIDDFGSGYSSLGVFEQIQASVVKLDRSFLLNQENRERQVAIMRGIVNLTGALEAQIVCEGVETEDDIALMKEIGAYVAQGYFYSKPVPEAEFAQKLSA